jgi:hypothetical protein
MQIVTANRLIDGLVVFLAPSGDWVVGIGGALVMTEAATVEAELARAALDVAARKVVEPYAVDVELKGGAVVPKSLRERIRAGGPTVPSDFPDQMIPRGERIAAA